MINIAFYGSHNAAYAVEKDGEIVLVLEVERFLNYKNSGLAQYMCPKNDDLLFLAEYIPKFIMQKLGIKMFDTCYHMNTEVILGTDRYDLKDFILAREFKPALHHQSHAANAFYQSPYQEALAFSFDGGGNDGFFNIYKCVRGEQPKLLQQVLSPTHDSPHIYYDLGFPYMVLAHYLEDIKKDPLNIGNLVYPGKLMGLASYGTVREEWLEAFITFYKSKPEGTRIGPWDETGYNDYEPKVKQLGAAIGISFNEHNRLTGQEAYDIAATSQKAFEECFLEVVKPYMDEYPDLPVCVAGGCGLNITLNTRLVTEFKKDVFVGPNPNDCGLAVGMLLNHIKPTEPVDITYSGLELLDLDMLGHYIQNSPARFKTHYYGINRMMDDLSKGKIVGVARGRAEHGPRALGNRSILCDPTIPGMKDILNEKVKHREWYRPFAPVVRLEDVSKYFEWDRESRWMSFCPRVKEEWREQLAAITHVDGTARVQTVTKDQNPFIYNLLTEYSVQKGVGVLVNTSFNVDGMPILSTIRDAFTILEKTQLDCLVLEDYYIRKTA